MRNPSRIRLVVIIIIVSIVSMAGGVVLSVLSIDGLYSVYTYILSRTCQPNSNDNSLPCNESELVGKVDDEIMIAAIKFATEGLGRSNRLCIGVRGYPWVGPPPANTSENMFMKMELPDYQMEAIKGIYPLIDKLHKCVIMTAYGMKERNETDGQSVLMIDWPKQIMGGYFAVGYEYMMIGDIHSLGTSMILSSCGGTKIIGKSTYRRYGGR